MMSPRSQRQTSIFISLFLGGVVFGKAYAEDLPTASSAPLTLAQVLLITEKENPDLLAARQAWKMAQAQVSPARAWPNPVFSFSHETVPSEMANAPDFTLRHYRVEQAIPFPGKLSSEARMKYHEAMIAEASYRAKVLDILRDVRMRYYQLYLTDQKIALASQSVDLWKATLEAARARLAANQASAADVFMAQTELHQMENNLFEQRQQRDIIQAELNTLLNRSADTSWGPARPPELVDCPVSLKDLEVLARHDNPHYLMARHEINHSRSMLARNRLEFAPDFGFMYGYNQAKEGTSGREIGFSVAFPLWLERPWGLAQSAKAHIQEAEASSRGMENEVMKGVHIEWAELQTRLTLARRYESSILPSALGGLNITRQQYASGRADFLRLLEAFRLWIQTHNDYQEELYRYGEHWAELGNWVGVDLAQAREALEQERLMPEEEHHEK